MSGFLHLMVPAEKVRVLGGEGFLTTYQFGLRIARHTFCSLCGIKALYRPRSDPTGFSVNLHCLNRKSVVSTDIIEFDGQRWEENIARLKAHAA